jgi:TPR repeat protein
MNRLLLAALRIFTLANATAHAQKSASAPNASSAKDLIAQAKAAEANKDSDGAEKLYQQAALTGDAEGQYEYGERLATEAYFGVLYNRMNHTGQDTDTQSPGKDAIAWLLKSAAQGYVPAMNSLGDLYSSPDMLPQLENEPESFKWWMKAAKLGDVDAEGRVAEMLEEGKGVKQDTAAAIQWYTEAAAQKDDFAEDALIRLAPAPNDPVQQAVHNGMIAENNNDSDTAMRCYQQAANAGSADGEYRVGNLQLDYLTIQELSDSIGDTKPDPAANAKACSTITGWLEKSAAQGYLRAMDDLGQLFGGDMCPPSDPQQGFAWYQKAAEQGDKTAQYELGVLYEKGTGVAKDSAQAAQWYQKAAAQGDKDAQQALAAMKNP